MIRRILWLCYLPVGLLLNQLLVSSVYGDACVNSASAAVVGLASSDGGREFLYCEYHYREGDKVRVEYYDRDQTLIALKQVDYSQSSLAPAIYQDDYRHAEKVRVQHLQDTNTDQRYLFMQYQGANQEELSEKPTSNDGSLIVDAGFDNAIRFYWDEIAENSSATLNFVAPARLRTIELKVRKKPLSRCAKEARLEEYNESEHICYVVRPLNGLVSLFVKPIKLIYERETKRLLLFRGNSNITDEQGMGQQVAIDYRYYDLSP